MLSCPNARQQSRRTRRGLAFSQRGCENARACPRIPRRQQGAQHNTRNQRSRARVSSARICSPPTRTHINMRRPLRAHIHSVRPKENTHARTSQREGSIPQPEKRPTTRDARPPRERELCDSLSHAAAPARHSLYIPHERTSNVKSPWALHIPETAPHADASRAIIIVARASDNKRRN